MDSKKIFFILLMILAVLYFVSLGTGIALNDSGGKGGQPKNLSNLTDQWVGALGPLLSVFAPALDLTRLECRNQSVGRSFTLQYTPTQVDGGSKRSCDIRIPPDSEEDYRKAQLITDKSSVTVYVRAKFDPDRFHPKHRERNCYLDGETLSAALLRFTYTRPNERPLRTDKLPEGPRLEVQYVPPPEDGGNGDSEGKMWECWLAQEAGKPVPITAFKGGGTLKLAVACDDCDKQSGAKAKPVVVTLRME